MTEADIEDAELDYLQPLKNYETYHVEGEDDTKDTVRTWVCILECPLKEECSTKSFKRSRVCSWEKGNQRRNCLGYLLQHLMRSSFWLV